MFACSSTRGQSNKRSGTRLKTESETGKRFRFLYGRVRLFRGVRLLRHALPISLLILRKNRVFCSLALGSIRVKERTGAREGDTQGERERLPERPMKIVSRPLSNYPKAAAWSVKYFDRNRLTSTLGTRGFSRVRWEFWVLADATSGEAFRADHYKDLTETGNRASKVSGTQGNWPRTNKACQSVVHLYPRSK